MSQILRYENNVVNPSELELLIFPELKNNIRDESELQLERLINFNNNYNLPPIKFDTSLNINLVKLKKKTCI